MANRSKRQIEVDLSQKIKATSYDAFFFAMKTKYDPANPEKHIEKMAQVFSSRMTALAKEILVLSAEYPSATDQDNIFLG